MIRMNLEDMASAIGFDKSDFIELAEMLLETSRSDLEKFVVALNAGELKKAAMSAHSIKGASANLGFTEMATAAATLETLSKTNDISPIAPQITLIEDEMQKIDEALKGWKR